MQAYKILPGSEVQLNETILLRATAAIRGRGSGLCTLFKKEIDHQTSMQHGPTFRKTDCSSAQPFQMGS